MESHVAPARGGKNTGREDVGGLFLSFTFVLVSLGQSSVLCSGTNGGKLLVG